MWWMNAQRKGQTMLTLESLRDRKAEKREWCNKNGFSKDLPGVGRFVVLKTSVGIGAAVGVH